MLKVAKLPPLNGSLRAFDVTLSSACKGVPIFPHIWNTLLDRIIAKYSHVIHVGNI